MYCYAYNNVFKNDILGLDTIERDISELWKHYVASNPNRNQRLDNQRKQILAHGCIGYACLYTGKSPDMIFLSNQKCFLSLERAIKEKKAWIESKKCCSEVSDNGTSAEPKIFSVHSHIRKSELKLIGDIVDTSNFMYDIQTAFIAKAKQYPNESIGNFDFGLVEEGDTCITSGNHYHSKEERAKYYTRSIEEWKGDVRKNMTDSIIYYESEIWCVTCNDQKDFKFHFSNMFVDF